MFVKLLIILIRLYQWTISPMLGPICRFHPTCSNYCMQALSKYGFLKGLYLGFKRLLRCHPYCDGGDDPVI